MQLKRQSEAIEKTSDFHCKFKAELRSIKAFMVKFFRRNKFQLEVFMSWFHI